MIQINIRQQWTEVSALRSALKALLEYPFVHYPAFKEHFYERKNSPICNLFAYKIHHYLMVNMVEESFDICIYYPVVAFLKVRFTLLYCRMGIGVGSVTMALGKEYPFKDGFKYVLQGLLDYSISHCRNPKFPHLPIVFWDHHS